MANAGIVEAPLVSTMPEGLNFQLKGFADEETAKKLGNYTIGFVHYLGTKLNLERLDGFTIAYDYPQALLDLDRGYETTFVLAPTTEFATGVAMSPMVKREGIIKTHIVLFAGTFIDFLDQENENWLSMFYQLAHECAHVHDHRAFDIALPNLLLTKHDFGDDLTSQIYQLGSLSWSEYAACRLSAAFGPTQVQMYEEMFFVILEELDERLEAVMAAFRQDHDGWKCYRALSGEYERVAKFTSYLFGHLAAFEQSDDLAPKFNEFRRSNHWLVEYIEDLEKALEGVWEKYGQWKSTDDFEAIGEVVISLLSRQDMYLFLQSGELMLNIE